MSWNLPYKEKRLSNCDAGLRGDNLAPESGQLVGGGPPENRERTGLSRRYKTPEGWKLVEKRRGRRIQTKIETF
jgi:hypothetical protein